jgi:hypothetical protein
MTPTEQDADLAQAQAMLPPAMAADRCRHESISHTSLWIYGKDKKQCGSITRTADGQWRASRIYRGMPTSERHFDTLAQAMEHVTST